MLTSLIRTLVPLIVGFLISIPVIAGTGVSSEQLAGLVTALVTAGYYALARFLEAKVSPSFGWLLGKPGAPVYPPTP